MRRLRRIGLILPCLFLGAALPVLAQSKKEDKSAAPKILCANPLTVSPGVTKTVKLRGLQLAEATAVKVESAGVAISATIKSKGKSEAPKPFEANKVGDAEAVVELKLPSDLKAGELTVTLTTPAGVTPAFAIRVAEAGSVVDEKEPNNGFKAAQELPARKTVLGVIENVGDVDVFKIGGQAGTKLVIELIAQRCGSPMDGLVTLYDAAGNVLATADDAPAPEAPVTDAKPGAAVSAVATGAEAGAATARSRDPILRATLPTTGAYFVCVTDANDRGSSVHAYELRVREER